MAQLLGNVTVGSIVKLNENGSPVDYLVVHQGLPGEMYDSSCDGTWLLRKDIYNYTSWGVNSNYINSNIYSYNNNLLSLYDKKAQQNIKEVKIPYLVGGGNPTIFEKDQGIECKIFPLSIKELGIPDQYGEVYPIDGEKLDYFEIGNTTYTSAANKRISIYQDTPGIYATRSAYVANNDMQSVWQIGTTGVGTSNLSKQQYGIRQTIILPKTIHVMDDNSLFNIPVPNLSVNSNLIIQNQTIFLSWTSNVNVTSYQLQRNTGSSWETIYTGPNISYEDTAGNWSSVQYQVCALIEEEQGAYSDPQTITILPPSAVPTINSISTVNLTESFTITWNSAANADSYVLQRNIGSGWEEVYSGISLEYQDQALYSNMSYRVASVITDLYQSAWSPEYIVDINGQMIEMNIKNDDGSYEAIYPKTLIGNIVGIEDQYYTKQETLQSSVAQLIGLTNQAVPNDMFNILAHVGDLHVWKRTVEKESAGYTLGEQMGETCINSQSNTTSASTYKYSDSVSVSQDGIVSLVSPSSVFVGYNSYANANTLSGKFFSPEYDSGGNAGGNRDILDYNIYFVDDGATVSRENLSGEYLIYISACRPVNGYKAETTIDYPVSTDRNAYQEGSDAQPAGYTLGEVKTGKFYLTNRNNPSQYTYFKQGEYTVSEDGTLSLPSENSIDFTGYESELSNVQKLLGKKTILSAQSVGSFTVNSAYYFPDDAVITHEGGSGNQGYWVIDRYQPVTGYPAIPANTIIEYMGQLGGFDSRAKVEIGSYTGTGVSGDSNYSSLTFNFDPQVVFISCVNASPNIAMIVCTSKTTYFKQFGIVIGGGSVYGLYSSCMNKVLNFFTTRGAEYQMNRAGETYNYIALG